MLMKSYQTRTLILIVGLMSVAGCSLVTIKSPIEPIPERDLAARLMTRELSTVFADRVQVAADEISSAVDDPDVQLSALRWKIEAIGACRQAALRQDPRQALVDVWALCVQQRDFLATGAGSAAFGTSQSIAVAAAEQLVADIEEVARLTMAPGVRSTMAAVVASYTAEFPLASLAFERESILPAWQEAAGGEGRVATVGTSPEVAQDVADRMRIMGEQIPDALRWRAELTLSERAEEIAELRSLLERLSEGLVNINELAQNSPELAALAARELQRELRPSLDRIDARWGQSLETLASEREMIVSDLERMQASLTASLKTEREALTNAVDAQRASIMAETGEIAADVTDRALSQLRVVAREVMLLAILLAAVVLGLPFAAGYLVGKARSRAVTR